MTAMTDARIAAVAMIARSGAMIAKISGGARGTLALLGVHPEDHSAHWNHIKIMSIRAISALILSNF
jgi:hypothetical protein